MRRPSASEDLLRLGEVLLDVNSRNESLIEGLLLLARSGNELTSQSYVDMSDVVEHVIALTHVDASAATVTVTASRSEAPVLGDAVLLERMVHNLIENGIRHNQRNDGWVQVQARSGVRPSGDRRLQHRADGAELRHSRPVRTVPAPG